MIYVLYAIGALIAVIILIVLIAIVQPSDFEVARSQQINSSPEKLFPYINNLKKFQEWNPYKERDVNARNEFSGAEEGPGAVFRWSGDNNVGEGIMTIVNNDPNQKVNVDLEFIRPFSARNSVEFSLTPETGGTVVRWGMKGRHALVPKIMGLFMSMDKMIGNDFEYGLKRLKSLAETGAV